MSVRWNPAQHPQYPEFYPDDAAPPAVYRIMGKVRGDSPPVVIIRDDGNWRGEWLVGGDTPGEVKAVWTRYFGLG